MPQSNAIQRRKGSKIIAQGVAGVLLLLNFGTQTRKHLERTTHAHNFGFVTSLLGGDVND